MKKMRRWTIGLLCFAALFLFAVSQKAEASETVVKGSYTYFAEDGVLYKMHTTTGKIKKITTIKRSNTVEVFAVKGDWLYLTVDDYYSKRGTDKMWPYVCRIKTNGKQLETLAQGEEPNLYGNYIYYSRCKINKKSDAHPQSKGIYRMKLDGSQKKKVSSTGDRCYWAKIYKKRIYFSCVVNESFRVYSVGLDGKDLKREATGQFTSARPYFYQNMMYLTLEEAGMETSIYKKDLTTGEMTRFLDGAVCAGYGGELYYSTGKWGNKVLRRYQLKQNQSRKICSRMSFGNVIGGKKWVIFNYYRGNKRYNIGVDRVTKEGKNRKVIDTYFRS